MCTVAIPQGERLEIKEGTHIVFMGNFDFGTNGNCFASGTIDKPILFTYGFNYTGQGWHWIGTYIPGGTFNVMLNSDSLIFDNCIFEKCNQPYFEFMGPFSQVYFEMKNCVLRHMSNGLLIQIGGMPDSSYLSNVKHFVIKNNIFQDVNYTFAGYLMPIISVGFVSQAGWPCNTPSVEIVNNIFYQAISYSYCSSNYNCYYNSQPDSMPAEISTGGNLADALKNATCVFKDPKFVDIANGNYRLAPGSPCIGAGMNGEDMGLEFNQ